MVGRQTNRVNRGGNGRLEVILAASVLVLALLAFPSLWFRLLRLADVRSWSRSVWLWMNVGVVLSLFGIRFVPGLYQNWRQHRSRLARNREKKEIQCRALEQQEMWVRLREGRRRRIF